MVLWEEDGCIAERCRIISRHIIKKYILFGYITVKPVLKRACAQLKPVFIGKYM